eukprot:TRINITY_DN2532_c0_g1_i1.p1 TRINITY_DN2532_c0_g1~~TRINITY_DN2532_c0_g1_i1.p1  ORF type:complete len:518 (-),score=189.42 TRINITY_DN2532_c0_g1_i1:333-1886(-)
MGTEFKRLALKQFPQIQEKDTPEAKYWRKFGGPVVETHDAHCTSLHYSPAAPYDLAVSCGSHVSIRSGATGAKLRAISRFQGVAYSGVFRGDGRLIAGGDAKGSVIVADATSKAMLRTFAGHAAAVRAVRWSADGLRLASASDDKSVRLWDLPTGAHVGTREGHTDYVRAMDASAASADAWVTGGYDGTVRLWDARAAGAVRVMEHGAPVEAVLCLPGGSLVASAGGNVLKIWDAMGGGKLVHECSHHQKTITCLALNGSRTRLLTGGLDGLVKICSLSTYQVMHGLRFQAPLLSLALSTDGVQMAAGTADCALTQRRRPAPSAAAVRRAERPLYAPQRGTPAYLKRGSRNAVPGLDDTLVEQKRHKPLQPYDQSLRKFRYQEALDLALATRSPIVVASVLEELIQRRGLNIALAGRDEVTLEPILAFLARYIASPRYAPLLIDVTHAVADAYASALGESEGVDELFARLQRQIHCEVDFQKDMHALLGSMDAVIAAASLGAGGGDSCSAVAPMPVP